MYTAYGMRKRYMRRSTTAWIRPVTGDLPPLLMLAIVLARAPVAGIPPNIGVMMFAIPCPISSVFELCLLPVAPSATMAARSDSIAQRMAIVKAGETSPLIVSKSNSGATGFGIGRPFASSGNLEPMVAKSTPANLPRRTDTTVPNISAISEPGIFLVTLPQNMHMRRQPMLIANSTQLMDPIFCR